MDMLPDLGRLPLARDDVDRGTELRDDETLLTQLWERPNTRILWLHGRTAPVYAGQIVLTAPQGELPAGAVYLGRSAHHRAQHSQFVEPAAEHVEIILLVADSKAAAPSLKDPQVGGMSVEHPDYIDWLGVFDIAAGLDDRDVGIFVSAVAIANWHKVNKYCPRCGTKTQHKSSGWVQVCPQDGSEHFPRTDPAVIMLITDSSDRALLGNNKAWGDKRYSALAGFVEPGESLEAAVKREVYEESQVVVDGVKYMGSQPWPFPQSLMLGFLGRTDRPDDATADKEEIAEVRWFSRDELRDEVENGRMYIPGASSIAHHLLRHWYGGPLPQPRTLEN
ncbi:NAD(+) diphosphatase [Enteractinococcus coprophilus]|nr:NAD(+) diphosphatase [Enteractinococcus coprophilus]